MEFSVAFQNNPIIWFDNAKRTSHIRVMTQKPLALRELWNANRDALTLRGSTHAALAAAPLAPDVVVTIQHSPLAFAQQHNKLRGPDSQSRASFALRPGRESVPSATRSTLESESQPCRSPAPTAEEIVAGTKEGLARHYNKGGEATFVASPPTCAAHPRSKSAQHLLGKPAQAPAAHVATDLLKSGDVTTFVAALRKRVELVAAGQPITPDSVLLAAVAGTA